MNLQNPHKWYALQSPKTNSQYPKFLKYQSHFRYIKLITQVPTIKFPFIIPYMLETFQDSLLWKVQKSHPVPLNFLVLHSIHSAIVDNIQTKRHSTFFCFSFIHLTAFHFDFQCKLPATSLPWLVIPALNSLWVTRAYFPRPAFILPTLDAPQKPLICSWPLFFVTSLLSLPNYSQQESFTHIFIQSTNIH